MPSIICRDLRALVLVLCSLGGRSRWIIAFLLHAQGHVLCGGEGRVVGAGAQGDLSSRIHGVVDLAEGVVRVVQREGGLLTGD